MKGVSEESIAAALKHLGFDSVADLHYWAMNDNELSRFDALCAIIDEAIQAAEQRGMERERERCARIAEADEAGDWTDGVPRGGIIAEKIRQGERA